VLSVGTYSYVSKFFCCILAQISTSHIEIPGVIIEKPFRSICVYCIPAAPTVNTVDTFLKQLINNTEKLNVLYIFH